MKETNKLEKFAECFCGRLCDGRINYYLKGCDDNSFKANTIHSGIIWSREAVKEIDELKNIEIDDFKNRDLLCLITYIDLLLDATDQIYRVLYNTNALEKFSGKSSFPNKPIQYINQDDRTYFKELRAIFSAHPVNIKEPNKRTKRFADIPLKKNVMCIMGYPPITGSYDFYERIWTNTKHDEDTIYMPIKISELLDFSEVLINRFDLFLKRLRIIAYHRDKL